MHSVRDKKDKRGNTLSPDAEALALQSDTHLPGIESILEQTGEMPSPDWTKVITNPGPFCKGGLT